MPRIRSSNIPPCIRLNADVLREIFIHCVSDPENNPAYFVLDGRKRSIRELPQLSVSRVCSLWRHAALLTPQLWNNIRIYHLTEANLKTAREYLSRAENLPVSTTLSRRETAGEDWRSQLIDFLSSYRIQTLVVTPKMSRFHLILPDLPQRSVADLDSLSIFNHLDHEEAQIDLNDTRYPKLAVIRIWGTHKISGFNSSLRIFDGTKLSMTVNESWDLLSRCPSLEESHFRITRVNDSRRPVSIPQIHLRRLRLLALHSESKTDVIPFSTFIEVLTLPVVEELHVFHARIAWSMTAFQSLAHRSNYFPHLRDLVLRNPTSVVDVGALLALTPSLKSISLCSGISTSHAFYDHLALNGLASGSLAPRLQSLIVGHVSNAGLFVDMVESRMENAQTSSNGVPAPFTRVVFFAMDRRYHDSCHRLLDMRQRGIPIKLWRYHI
ncbi:hypothetical protein M378DRAFT_166313 [Amanita muscaria Koide BX008]|uniref:F-box domain-containing protein n=1 Tax=Amanita muscaria (strain Koide BX008) TaxID=946122 RepID=A0A0C2WYP8_AMAMK|nr:hypothetical protein M378DRAFT_166313 [Amanita muscaria Koide BX008]